MISKNMISICLTIHRNNIDRDSKYYLSLFSLMYTYFLHNIFPNENEFFKEYLIYTITERIRLFVNLDKNNGCITFKNDLIQVIGDEILLILVSNFIKENNYDSIITIKINNLR